MAITDERLTRALAEMLGMTVFSWIDTSGSAHVKIPQGGNTSFSPLTDPRDAWPIQVMLWDAGWVCFASGGIHRWFLDKETFALHADPLRALCLAAYAHHTGSDHGAG